MADIDTEVVHAESRASDYWFGDGIWLLLFSVCTMLWGCWALLHPKLPFWKSMAGLVPILAFSYLLIARRSPILSWLKSRITYPRSGYASMDPKRLKSYEFKHYPEVLVVAFSAGVFNLDPPWVGLIALAAGLGFLRGKFGFSFLIPGIALSGILVAAYSPHEDKMPWLLIALAALYFVKGTAQLLLYLRKHSLPQP
jgi:hypothetical protein